MEFEKPRQRSDEGCGFVVVGELHHVEFRGT